MKPSQTTWDEIKLSGFLEKRSTWTKTWNWRWITLSQNTLKSFFDETESNCTGEFFLHSECSAEVISIDSEHPLVLLLRGKYPPNHKQSKSQQSEFYLSVSDKSLLEHWVLAIIQTICGVYGEDENFFAGDEDEEGAICDSEQAEISDLSSLLNDEITKLSILNPTYSSEVPRGYQVDPIRLIENKSTSSTDGPLQPPDPSDLPSTEFSEVPTAPTTTLISPLSTPFKFESPVFLALPSMRLRPLLQSLWSLQSSHFTDLDQALSSAASTSPAPSNLFFIQSRQLLNQIRLQSQRLQSQVQDQLRAQDKPRKPSLLPSALLSLFPSGGQEEVERERPELGSETDKERDREGEREGEGEDWVWVPCYCSLDEELGTVQYFPYHSYITHHLHRLLCDRSPPPLPPLLPPLLPPPSLNPLCLSRLAAHSLICPLPDPLVTPSLPTDLNHADPSSQVFPPLSPLSDFSSLPLFSSSLLLSSPPTIEGKALAKGDPEEEGEGEEEEPSPPMYRNNNSRFHGLLLVTSSFSSQRKQSLRLSFPSDRDCLAFFRAVDLAIDRLHAESQESLQSRMMKTTSVSAFGPSRSTGLSPSHSISLTPSHSYESLSRKQSHSSVRTNSSLFFRHLSLLSLPSLSQGPSQSSPSLPPLPSLFLNDKTLWAALRTRRNSTRLERELASLTLSLHPPNTPPSLSPPGQTLSLPPSLPLPLPPLIQIQQETFLRQFCFLLLPPSSLALLESSALHSQREREKRALNHWLGLDPFCLSPSPDPSSHVSPFSQSICHSSLPILPLFLSSQPKDPSSSPPPSLSVPSYTLPPHISSCIPSLPSSFPLPRFLVFVVFENQRYLPLKGWNCLHLLPADPPKLSDVLGFKFPDRYLRKTEVKAALSFSYSPVHTPPPPSSSDSPSFSTLSLSTPSPPSSISRSYYRWYGVEDVEGDRERLEELLAALESPTPSRAPSRRSSTRPSAFPLPLVDWQVDKGYMPTDEEGWSYARHFAGLNYHLQKHNRDPTLLPPASDPAADHVSAKPRRTDVVRRRKWVKIAIRVDEK